MKAIQYTCCETTEVKAQESLAFLRSQNGFLGGRVYKSMKLGFDPPERPWKVQAFVEANADDRPGLVLSQSPHDEMRVVIVPDSQLAALGIAKPASTSFDRTGTFKITLRAVPNPDVDGGWWDGPKGTEIVTGPLGKVLEAGRRYSQGIGGGNWSGGQIYRKEGKKWNLVARMSYNGRVWPPGPFASGQKPLLEGNEP